jgi:hypothetical protein
MQICLSENCLGARKNAFNESSLATSSKKLFEQRLDEETVCKIRANGMKI